MQGWWVELACHFLAHGLYPGFHSVFSCVVRPPCAPQRLSSLAMAGNGAKSSPGEQPKFATRAGVIFQKTEEDPC